MFGGDPIYQDFRLTEYVYNEAADAWYFPLEELMYLAHMQWMCEDGVVIVYRPETLLDVLADMYQRDWSMPDYQDIMGETAWEQMENSVKYGFMAAIDEMSLSFYLDTFLSCCNIKGATGYEEDVLTEALLLLNIDVPQEGQYAVTAENIAVAGEFASASGTTLEGALNSSMINRLYAMLGAPITSEIKDAITSRATVGINLIQYAADVAQTLWMREYMTENFAQRIQYITAYSSAKSTGDKSNLYDLLSAVGQTTYDVYVSELPFLYMEEITLDRMITMTDNLALANGLDFASGNVIVGPLRNAALGVALVDLAIEASSMLPVWGEMMNNAEEIHLCLKLVQISEVMQQAWRENMEILLNPHWVIQDYQVDTLRLSMQTALCAGMHAHDKLIQLGRMSSCDCLPEEEFLQRLNQAAKYDGLLILDREMHYSYSEEAGYVRMEIPEDYVVEYMVREAVSDACHYHAPMDSSGHSVVYYIPRVNLYQDMAAAVNDTIYQELIGCVKKENTQYPTDKGMDYLWTQYEDILSILVRTDADWDIAMTSYHVYNVSAKTGDRLSNQTLWEAYGMTEAEYYERLQEIVKAFYAEYYAGYEEDKALEFMYDSARECEKTCLSDENLEAAMPYIDENGDLCVAMKFYYFAGPPTFYRLCNLTGTETPKEPSCELHENGCLEVEDEDAPYDSFLTSGCYNQYLAAGESREGYKVLDVNGDGRQELILCAAGSSPEFHSHKLFTVNSQGQIQTLTEDVYSYQCLTYSKEYGALGYFYPRPDSMASLYHGMKIENDQWYEAYVLYREPMGNVYKVGQYDADGNEIFSWEDAQEEYEAMMASFQQISWYPLP